MRRLGDKVVMTDKGQDLVISSLEKQKAWNCGTEDGLVKDNDGSYCTSYEVSFKINQVLQEGNTHYSYMMGLGSGNASNRGGYILLYTDSDLTYPNSIRVFVSTSNGVLESVEIKYELEVVYNLKVVGQDGIYFNGRKIYDLSHMEVNYFIGSDSFKASLGGLYGHTSDLIPNTFAKNDITFYEFKQSTTTHEEEYILGTSFKDVHGHKEWVKLNLGSGTIITEGYNGYSSKYGVAEIPCSPEIVEFTEDSTVAINDGVLNVNMQAYGTFTTYAWECGAPDGSLIHNFKLRINFNRLSGQSGKTEVFLRNGINQLTSVVLIEGGETDHDFSLHSSQLPADTPLNLYFWNKSYTQTLKADIEILELSNNGVSFLPSMEDTIEIKPCLPDLSFQTSDGDLATNMDDVRTLGLQLRRNEAEAARN